MSSLIKLLFIAQLLSLSISAITRFYFKPLTLILTLLINFLVWYVFWFCANYIIGNPQKTTTPKWDFMRWFTLFYFSIFAMELGSLGASLLRFLINTSYILVGGQIRDIFAPFEPWSVILLSALGILLAAPLVFPLSQSLRLRNPKGATIKILALWAFLILLLRPLSSFFR